MDLVGSRSCVSEGENWLVVLVLSVKIFAMSSAVIEVVGKVCMERSRVGRSSTLQGQSDWEKPLVGVLKSVRLKCTQYLCS